MFGDRQNSEYETVRTEARGMDRAYMLSMEGLAALERRQELKRELDLLRRLGSSRRSIVTAPVMLDAAEAPVEAALALPRPKIALG